ncbi:MAG TPA: hypothetical protein VKV15_11025 [Bryobacteraceae bacterium]|nr:hypothetical protein [Bryobacteraceae bacterium]
MVFTLPHELIPAVVYNLFFRAVSQALLTIAADPRHLGVAPAGSSAHPLPGARWRHRLRSDTLDFVPASKVLPG